MNMLQDPCHSNLDQACESRKARPATHLQGGSCRQGAGRQKAATALHHLEEISVRLHRRRLAPGALAFLLLLAGAASVSAQDQEQEISCKAVPAAVRAAFEKSYPKASIKACAKEVEQDKTAYEIASMDGKIGRDVLYFADGTLIVVEETTTLNQLPEPVQQAVRKKYPRDPITLVEKIMRDDTVSYEFQIKHRGKTVETVFDAGGNEVKP
jgi:Putative beta-lactamase-inhibitor-like, PepSY-like